jgi:hypothetical protein
MAGLGDFNRFTQAVRAFNELEDKDKGDCPLPVYLDDQTLPLVLGVHSFNSDKCIIADTGESIIVATTIEKVASQVMNFCGVCLKCKGPIIRSGITKVPFNGGYSIQHYKKPNIE